MLANLPAILKHLGKEGKAAAAGQGALFGAIETSELQLVERPDWDDHTKLWHERRVLGTFVSGHPLDRYREKLAGKVTHQCRESFDMQRSGSNVRLVVAGLVRSFRRMPRIAYLTLEDGTGAVDIISFNDESDRFAHCLMTNAILVVKVQARHDHDRSSLRLLQAHRLGHFREPK